MTTPDYRNILIQLAKSQKKSLNSLSSFISPKSPKRPISGRHIAFFSVLHHKVSPEFCRFANQQVTKREMLEIWRVLLMDKTDERRTEQRLRYYWPIWYAENFDETLAQGQMVDISSRGAAFTCYANNDCPYPGQHITARFSVPQYGRCNRGQEDDTKNGYFLKMQTLLLYWFHHIYECPPIMPFE